MPRFNEMYHGQKYASIAISAASGDQTLISAVSGAKIRVHAMEFVTDTASALTIKSGSTTIAGAQSFGANGGKVLPLNDAGWFETAAGEALIMNVGTAATIGGSIVYSEIV